METSPLSIRPPRTCANRLRVLCHFANARRGLAKYFFTVSPYISRASDLLASTLPLWHTLGNDKSGHLTSYSQIGFNSLFNRPDAIVVGPKRPVDEQGPAQHEAFRHQTASGVVDVLSPP